MLRIVPALVAVIVTAGCSQEAILGLMGSASTPAIRMIVENQVKAHIKVKGGTDAQAACAIAKVNESLSAADLAATITNAKAGSPEEKKIEAAIKAAVDSCMAN